MINALNVKIHDISAGLRRKRSKLGGKLDCAQIVTPQI
jgi:hypothetical protein